MYSTVDPRDHRILDEVYKLRAHWQSGMISQRLAIRTAQLVSEFAHDRIAMDVAIATALGGAGPAAGPANVAMRTQLMIPPELGAGMGRWATAKDVAAHYNDGTSEAGVRDATRKNAVIINGVRRSQLWGGVLAECPVGGCRWKYWIPHRY